jgi:diguanylate cyclase (GGDEF)-like protein
MFIMMGTYVSFLTSGLEQAVGRRLAAATTGVRIQIEQHEQWLREEIERHASQALLIRSVAQQERESLDRLLTHFLGLSRAQLIGLYNGRGGPVTSFQRMQPLGPTLQADHVRDHSSVTARAPVTSGSGTNGAADEFFFDASPPFDEPASPAIVPTNNVDQIPRYVMEALRSQGFAMTHTLVPGGVQITAYRALDFSGRRVGVLYEGLLLDHAFVERLQQAFGLDVAIVDPAGRTVVGSLSERPELTDQGVRRELNRTTIGAREFFSTSLPLGEHGARDRGTVILLESQDVLNAAKRRAATFFMLVFGVIGGTVSLVSVAIANALTRKQRAAEDALEASRASFRNVVDKSAEGIVIVDLDRTIRFVNPSATLMFGNQPSVSPGETFGYTLGAHEPMEVEIIGPRGGKGVGEMLSVPTEWNGRAASLISVRDITDRKRAEEVIQHQAYHDALTQLPNRLLFNDRLNQELSRRSWQQRPVAVLFLDLDQFKQINDTLGHSVGDALLRSVAERLTECLREGDTIARLGGDEFTVVLTDLAKSDDIAEVAKKLLVALSKPFRLETHDLFVTASIGISVYPADGDNAETLIKHADTAMYRAKEHGRNTFQFYVPAMNTRVSERLAIETGLRHAIERNEFHLVYQPQVDLQTAHIIGVEALLRWRRSDGSMVAPEQFVPVAEETGLIVPIGEWVLRTACEQAAAWNAAAPVGLLVAVNISGRQFRHGGLVELVRRILDATHLDPRHLELELTESIIQNVDATITPLRELSGMNIQIAIDDFGTGYSSLSYLNRFPINKLKIDRSFVMDVPHRGDGCSIVNAIITLAHSLQLKAVAEGVEKPEQVEFLKALNCDIAQGYLFSKPLSAEAVGRLLATNTEFHDVSLPRDLAA